mmetsp:Transcript_1362/g.2386  ORF Transcript_1362/g.2386 Transcript_1362/m.2386 type:complete len:80 (-) Transcript_1362:100-339(-)
MLPPLSDWSLLHFLSLILLSFSLHKLTSPPSTQIKSMRKHDAIIGFGSLENLRGIVNRNSPKNRKKGRQAGRQAGFTTK